MLDSPVFQKTEAWAFLISVGSMGLAWIVWIFTQTAVIVYANEAAGCTAIGYNIAFNSTLGREQTDEEADAAEVDCQGKVHVFGSSMAPMSVLPMLTSLGTIITTILSPLVGALIDHTNYRREVLLSFAALYCFINCLQIFTFASTWILMTTLQVVLAAFAWTVYMMCMTSYSVEIAEDDSELVALQSMGRVYEISGMVLLLPLVLILSSLMGFSDVKTTARFAQSLVTIMSVPFFVMVMRRLKPRPALHEGSANISNAYKQLVKTIGGLRKTNPYVLQFLVGVAFASSAGTSAFVLLPIYMNSQLKIEDPSPLVAIVTVMCIPGALISRAICNRFGVKAGISYVFVLNSVIYAYMILFVYMEGQYLEIAISAAVVGMALGGQFFTMKCFFLIIIPAGQEVEMAGLYTFFQYILVFAPSMWFAYANDTNLAGAGVRIGMLSLNLFYIIALLLMSVFMNEKVAREHAGATAHKRIRVATAKVEPQA